MSDLDTIEERARRDMNCAYYLTYRVSMDTILSLVAELRAARQVVECAGRVAWNDGSVVTPNVRELREVLNAYLRVRAEQGG